MKKKIILMLSIILCNYCTNKAYQVNSNEKLDNFDPGDYTLDTDHNGKIRENVREAEPKMGYENFNEFIKNKLRYPKLAKEKRKEGTVLVEIMVDAKGDIFISDSWGFGYGSEDEAIRLIREAGKWKPAFDINKNKPFASSVMVKVNFNLR